MSQMQHFANLWYFDQIGIRASRIEVSPVNKEKIPHFGIMLIRKSMESKVKIR